MSKTIGGITRTVALIVMIVGAVVADGLLWWRWVAEGHPFYILFWATFWACIIALVVGYELFAYLTKRMTISTMYKKWMESSPAGRFWGTTILIILDIALNALILHLLVW